MKLIAIVLILACTLNAQSPDTIESYTNYVSGLLGIRFTPTQRETIRAQVQTYWRDRNKEAMGIVNNSAQTWNQYRNQPADLLDATFRLMRTGTLTGLQQAARGGAADSAYLLDLYYQTNPILAPGKPDGLPLTRDAIEADLAIKHWHATEIHRQPAPAPDAKLIDQAIAAAIQQHNQLSGPAQIQLAKQAGEWARIRYSWPKASPIDKLISRRDLGARLTPQEEAAVQQVIAGFNAQINGMVSQHRNAMFQSAMDNFKQNTDTIMGRGTVWNPATNRWEQQGGIVTEFNGTVCVP
jgi:hypothetical protein